MNERMSLIHTTMIFCKCQSVEELCAISDEQRQLVAEELECLRERIIQIATKQECSDLLRYLFDVDAESTKEATYDKLVRLLKHS